MVLASLWTSCGCQYIPWMGLGGDSQNMTTLRAGIQLPFGTEAALRAVGRKVVVAASAHEARQSRKVCFSGGSEKDGAQMMLTVQKCFPDLGTIPGQSPGWPRPYRSSFGTCSQNGEYGGNICFQLLSELFVIQAQHLELYTIGSCGCLGLFS